MAHHGRTPKTILDAPGRTYEVLSPQSGLSRAERRGQVAVSMKRRISAAVAGPNVPYRTPDEGDESAEEV